MALLRQDPYNPFFPLARGHPAAFVYHTLDHSARRTRFLPRVVYPKEGVALSGVHSNYGYYEKSPGFKRYPPVEVPVDYIDEKEEGKVMLYVFKYNLPTEGDPLSYLSHSGVWLRRDEEDDGEAHHLTYGMVRDEEQRKVIQRTDVYTLLETKIDITKLVGVKKSPLLIWEFDASRLAAVRDFIHNKQPRDTRLRCAAWAYWIVGETMRTVLRVDSNIVTKKIQEMQAFFQLGDEKKHQYLLNTIDGRTAYAEWLKERKEQEDKKKLQELKDCGPANAK